ncbi:hypothetical protein [Nocardioides sp. AN3]
MTELEELPRTPWWDVIVVLDDDGRFRFAYTVGLATDDLPELHLWSQPSLGEDPGADWRFSSSDMTQLLNDMGWRLAEGRLPTGTAWEEKYDAGQVTVRFRVGEATDARELEAYHAGDAPVLPIRWSLHREPDGPPTPLGADELAAATAELGAVLDDLSDDVPRTPVIVPGWEVPSPVARTAARPVGRAGALDRLVDDVADLVAGVGRTWAHDAWEEALTWFNDDGGEPSDEDWVKHILAQVIRPYLVSVAAADLLPPHVAIHGAGPLLCAMTPMGLPPSEAWHAAPHVIEATRALVLRAGPRRLAAAAVAWGQRDDDETADARGDLAAVQVTTPSMFPPCRSVLPARFAEDVERAGRGELGPGDVQGWLSVMTAVLSHRTRLDPATVTMVADCGEPHLPGLRRLLDEPLGAA